MGGVWFSKTSFTPMGVMVAGMGRRQGAKNRGGGGCSATNDFTVHYVMFGDAERALPCCESTQLPTAGAFNQIAEFDFIARLSLN